MGDVLMAQPYTLQYEHEGKLKFLHYPNTKDAVLGAIGLSITDNYKPLRVLTPNGGVAIGERALAQQIILAKQLPKSERDSWIPINNEIDDLAANMTKARRIFEKARSKRKTQEALEQTPGYGTFA
jgi:hypothetical protein